MVLGEVESVRESRAMGIFAEKPAIREAFVSKMDGEVMLTGEGRSRPVFPLASAPVTQEEEEGEKNHTYNRRHCEPDDCPVRYPIGMHSRRLHPLRRRRYAGGRCRIGERDWERRR